MVAQAATGPTTALSMPRLAFKPASTSNSSSTNDNSSDLLIGYGGAWLTPPHPTSINQPSNNTTTSPHGPGLQNLGNTCFLNAALQCLLHCVPLQQRLLRGGRHTNAIPPHSHNPRFCAFCALQSLATGLHADPAPRVIAPRAFAANAKAVCASFRPGRQEDAHEFVRALLEGMTKAEVFGCTGGVASRGTVVPIQREMTADVHRLFGGVLQSSVTCHHCQHVSSVTEPFLDLSLEIARVSSVERALAKFTAAEVLQGDNRYRCEGCKKLVVASKRFAVRRAPNVLTLHLKRFDRSRKDSRFIQYSEQLDLASYMYGKPEGEKAKYSLNAVLIHQGTSRQYGHYYAYVKGSGGTWCLKDDSTSRTVPLSTVLKQKAYILFYTRVLEKTSKTNNKNAKSTTAKQATAKRPASKQNGSTSATDPPSSGSLPSKNVTKVQPQTVKSLAEGRVQAAVEQSTLLDSMKDIGEKEAELSLSDESSSDDDSYCPSNESEEESEKEDDDESDVESEEILASGRADSPEPMEKINSSPVVRGPTASMRGPTANQALTDIAKGGDTIPVANAEEQTPTRRKFLGPIARRNETKGGKQEAELNKESEDDTEPSEPNSSADDDEMSSGSGSVRAILIGGGDAVRKVIRRVFGVQNPPKSEKKRSTPLSTPVNTPPTKSAKESPKENRIQKTVPKNTKPLTSPQNTAEKNTYSSPPSTNKQSATTPSPQVKSALFPDEGVQRWDADLSVANTSEGHRSFSRSKIVKRRRANDALDAEYDAGKSKKARSRYSPTPTSNTRQRVMFDQVTERRRRQKEKNNVKERPGDGRKNQGG